MKSVLCGAKADGVLSPEEKDWALGFCASWGVADWVIEELKTYEGDEAIEEVIARSPQVSMAQRDILLTTIWVCAADGKYHEQEKAKIRQMASILGVSSYNKKNLHYSKSALSSYILRTAPINQSLSRRGNQKTPATLTALAGSSIACPAVNAQLLNTYFSHFIRSGWLDLAQN
jgi:tellurite resistance protein